MKHLHAAAYLAAFLAVCGLVGWCLPPIALPLTAALLAATITGAAIAPHIGKTKP